MGSPWKAISDGNRRKILMLLKKRDMNPTAIAKHFDFGEINWDEFWNGTDWDYWESRQDDLCKNCAMHSGFEASVVRELPKKPGDMLRLAAWNLLG